MHQIFVSYSSMDAVFVKRLCKDLRELGYRLWLDKWQIKVGESIISRLQSGIQDCDFVLLVLSKNSVASPWVITEWQAKYWDEIEKRQIQVLPLIIDTCTVPFFLKGKKYADFRNRKEYAIALAELCRTLSELQHSSGLKACYPDFVEIECWDTLFRDSSSLDLLIMYSATWRNTYLKQLQRLLRSNSARLRVILPNPSQTTRLIRPYSNKLGIRLEELRKRILLAEKDFGALNAFGNVQIYFTNRYFYQALYLFESAGILALYSYKSERVATPAFLVGNGSLLQFLQNDFDWLANHDSQTTRRS